MRFHVHFSIKGLLTKLIVTEDETRQEVIGSKLENVSFVTDPRFGSSMSFDLELPVEVNTKNLKEPHYD